MQDHGYIALFRTVFGHRLFKDEKPVTRLHAWMWLTARAAWCQKQERVGNAIATLERGQLATTTRDLGRAWGWTHGKVRRFLETLKREAMIRTLTAGETGTAPGTATDSLSRNQYTIITICNYSKFQSPAAGQDSQPAQPPARRPTRKGQQQLDLGDEIPPQPLNHQTKDKGSVDKSGERARASAREKPRHGQKHKGKGLVFWDYLSPEWHYYADDYKDKRGALPMPKTYADGRGRWFNQYGESGDPKVLWSAERLARVG